VAGAAAALSTTAAAASWAQRSDATADVTAVVTAQNRPILGLGPSAFELRVGGTDVALDTVGDASSAPLNLGIVVHLGGGSVDLASDIAQQLGAFSLRTRSGGDLLLVTPGRAVPEWGSTADDIARTVGAAGESAAVDLAGLVAGALEAFEGRRGRSFLLVVSDGAGESSKSSWKDTVAVAEDAGVAVYVVGVRDSGFDSRARSSLTKIAAISGGRSYFLGDAGMTTMTLDYVGELIDASYALPFRAPEGSAEIKVEVANRGWNVAHPRRAP
jgi:hypothetical protein